MNTFELPVNTEENLKEKGDKALKYVSDKYGEEFFPVTYGLCDYLSDTDIVECYPSWMDPEHEHVSVFVHSDGTFGDNYFEYLVRDDLEAKVSELLEPSFGQEMKVYAGIADSEMPAELDEDSTIEDLYSAIPSYTISADVFVRNNEALSESSFDDLIAASEQKLCDTGKSFILNVFVVDPSAFDSLSREDLSSVMDTYNKTLEPDGAIVLNTAEVMVFLGKVD
jgi:hypothetical protein